MTKHASLIIIAISLLSGRASAAQSFEIVLRLQNDSSAVLPASEICGLRPLTLNAQMQSWQISASGVLRDDLQVYCLRHDVLGPHQSQRLSVQWRAVAVGHPTSQGAQGVYDLVDPPSSQLSELSNFFTSYPESERVQRIYSWMIENIAFSGIRRGIEGAEHALRIRSGDCTEHMLLAAELLERNGVTVRRVLGATVPRNEYRVRAPTLHNWVEYLDRGEWRIFDSSKKLLGTPSAERYVALLFYQNSQQLTQQIFSADSPRLKLFLQ